PASNTIRSMNYIGNGNFYQTREQPSALFVVNPFTGTANKIGTSLGGVLYNFLDIALDPTTGRLWMATDTGRASIYDINRNTGGATFRASISGVNQLTSIAIGPTGRFFISNASGNASVEDSIWELDPNNNFQKTLITTTGFKADSYLNSFAY